ncbi:ELWxxDGT repeat protein [Phnomibacter sp.]|uniref:ELWxxDGT repeat protein n=1 Tax=Phnomibacter sp. TaxID=2836217 RepID=UPI002FDDE941
MVKDMNEGTGDGISFTSGKVLYDFQGALYYTATNGAANSGFEIWKSDGTANGTIMLKDINPGTASSQPGQFLAASNVLYFSATEPTTGSELWKTDGTTAGTVIALDMIPGTGSGGAGLKLIRNDTLYFTTSNGTKGSELFKTDGTPAGTFLVKDIVPGATGSSPDLLTIAGNDIYFIATTTAEGRELWKTDGTAAGTNLVLDIFPGSSSSNINNMVATNTHLFFTANTPQYSLEVWTVPFAASNDETQWTGNTSTNWFDASNWSNGLPDAGKHIVIPAGRPRYPIITANTTIKKMTVSQGASVQIAAGIQVLFGSN